MKREFRLTKTTDFKRVRHTGKSYAHPLLVLVALSNELAQARVAVSASRSVGNAVQRNRAKRLMRECIRLQMPYLAPGWDLVFLARSKISGAAFNNVQDAVLTVLERAKLLKKTNG